MIKLFIFSIISLTLLTAEEYHRVPSPLPLPETTILKRDSINYDEERLHQFLLDGDIFSFLAYSSESMKSFSLRERRLVLNSLFNVSTPREFDGIKIALLLPENIIGRYSSFTTKAVTSYLLSKKSEFQLKNYFIKDESNETVSSALEEIMRDEVQFVVALMSINGAKVVNELSPNLFIYFPTVNRSKVETDSNYLYFGGIDYQRQIENLLSYYKGGQIALYYDASSRGEELNSIVMRELNISHPDANITMVKSISKSDSDFSKIYKDNNDTVGSSYFLNTTKVKSSILLAQLTSFDQEPELILSTQNNYTPILLSMTQYADRKSMIIANSISGSFDETIGDINSLLNNDIHYDWINYSTTVGVDYFYHLMSGEERSYRESIVNNQINYTIRFMKPIEAKFLEVVPVFDGEEDEVQTPNDEVVVETEPKDIN